MRGPKLVLKRFEFARPEGDGPLLIVEGRAPGLMGFFLNLLKLDPTTSMHCFSNRIEIVTASLSGRQSLTIPLSKVTGIQGGHFKPVGLLFAAVALFLSGFPFFLAGLTMRHGDDQLVLGAAAFIVAFIFLIAFFLSRTMNLSVTNGGDTAYGLRFGQGLIEGVAVDAARVEQAVALIRYLVGNAPRV